MPEYLSLDQLLKKRYLAGINLYYFLYLVEDCMTKLSNLAQRALNLIDLTMLNDDDTEESVITLCRQANTPAGPTAAICVYPRFIPLARKALQEQGTPNIRIATVANFPCGNDDIDAALLETHAAILYGADEIDIVFPYRMLLADNEQVGFELVKQCKQICQANGVLLKVIIESGKLRQASLIRKASEIVINAGADFIKSSTGKVSVNATLESAKLIMSMIRDMGVAETVGFKPAGGIYKAEDALHYLQLADCLLGDNWADLRHFRFGASRLLTNLLTEQDHI